MVTTVEQPTHNDAGDKIKDAVKRLTHPLKSIAELQSHIKDLYVSIDYEKRSQNGLSFSSKADQQVLAKIHRLKGFIALMETSSNVSNIALLVAMQYYKVSRSIEICRKRKQDIILVTNITDQKSKISAMLRENGYDAAMKQKETFVLALDFRLVEYIDKYNEEAVYNLFIKYK